MKSEVVTITPSKAKKWLEASTEFRNRRVSKRHVDNLAYQMLSDQWKLNGETIKFHNGFVIDGQHRLLACVQANTSFNSYVLHDIPQDVFTTLDTGKRRYQGDVLSMLGVPSALKTAAALQWINRIKQGNLYLRSNNTEVVRLQAEYSGIEEGFTYAHNVREFLGETIGIALFYLFAEKDPEKAKSFFEKFASGESLGKTSPLLWLRKQLMNRERGGHKRFIETAAKTVKAWNLFTAGKPASAQSLAWQEREAFPKIA